MIFFFTATGNSLFVAEKLAAATNDRIMDITACIQDKNFVFDLESNEPVGIITPVYFRGVPMIVTEFLRKLTLSHTNTYHYVVLNSGGSEASAEKFITHLFQTNAVFDVATVSNYVPSYKIDDEATINRKLDEAESRIDIIAQHINERDNGTFKKYAGRFPYLSSSLIYPLYKYGRKTRKFDVDENCIACGTCVKVCPRKIIKLENKEPTWKAKQCEICFACLHHCPVSAISYGKESKGNGRYLNPRLQGNG